MADKLSALKTLHSDLKAGRGPDRALDARIFQFFDPEARTLPLAEMDRAPDRRPG
jgi:hypothetical protein